MPTALAIPTTAQLARANGQLQHEIGERQCAEAALRDANAELERRVAERTADLEAEVAQRRQTEQTLRASEERWRSMFEASAVGIALTDENQRFVAVNEAFQRMLGYTPDELRSLGPIEITHEDDRPATQAMIDRMLKIGAPDTTSRSAIAARTAPSSGSNSTARPPAADSGLRGIPTIIEDITERKRAEEFHARSARRTPAGRAAQHHGRVVGVDRP